MASLSEWLKQLSRRRNSGAGRLLINKGVFCLDGKGLGEGFITLSFIVIGSFELKGHLKILRSDLLLKASDLILSLCDLDNSRIRS
jgi:hypothetical protein